MSPSMDWWVQAPLLSINVEEPQVTIMVGKWKVIFLLDSGAHFSALPFSPSPRCNDKVIIRGISGQLLKHYFTQPLACSWGDLHFCYSFLLVRETPVPLLGWDLLSQLKAQILLPPGDYLCCPLLQEQVDPTVWIPQRSLIISTSETVSPQAWSTKRLLTYHKFLRKTRASN
jgi:hypothetical protein